MIVLIEDDQSITLQIESNEDSENESMYMIYLHALGGQEPT